MWKFSERLVVWENMKAMDKCDFASIEWGVVLLKDLRESRSQKIGCFTVYINWTQHQCRRGRQQI